MYKFDNNFIEDDEDAMIEDNLFWSFVNQKHFISNLQIEFDKAVVIFNQPHEYSRSHVKQMVEQLMDKLLQKSLDENNIHLASSLMNVLNYCFVVFDSKNIADKFVSFNNFDFGEFNMQVKSAKNFDDSLEVILREQFAQMDRFMQPIELSQATEMSAGKQMDDLQQADTNKKIQMGNIPVHMQDNEVQKWVEAFAPIRSYNLVKDPSKAGFNKGYCFFEFLTDDDAAIDNLIDAMMAKDLQGRKLKIQRASIGKREVTPTPTPGTAVTPLGDTKTNSNDVLNQILASNFTQSCQIKVVNQFKTSDFELPHKLSQMQKLLKEWIDEQFVSNELKVSQDIIYPEINKHITAENMSIYFPYCYIEFKTVTFAKYLYFELNGKMFENRTVVVCFCAKEELAKAKSFFRMDDEMN